MLHVLFTLFGRTLLEGAAAWSSQSWVSQLEGLASVKKEKKNPDEIKPIPKRKLKLENRAQDEPTETQEVRMQNSSRGPRWRG